MKKLLRELAYGFTTFGQIRFLERKIFVHNSLFMIALFGDMLGIPFAPPIYRLKMLPHLLPLFDKWREFVLKERDLVEKLEFE